MFPLLYNLILSVLLGRNVAALAWQGPPRTAVVQTIEATGTFAPTPTPTSSESLLKRQFMGGPGFCAYVNQDIFDIVGCGPSDVCRYNTAYSWWGCCFNASSSAENCPIQVQCIDYQTLGNCNTSCLSNPMILKCTDSRNPYCIVSTLIDASLTHFACGAQSTILSFATIPALPSVAYPIVNQGCLEYLGPSNNNISGAASASTSCYAYTYCAEFELCNSTTTIVGNSTTPIVGTVPNHGALLTVFRSRAILVGFLVATISILYVN